MILSETPRLASHIGVGSGKAIPACSLAITRRLYHITSHRNLVTTKKNVSVICKSKTRYVLIEFQKIKEICIDLFLCLGIPVISMSLCK